MWPPIEMFGIVNVMTRLSTSHSPSPLSIGLIPRRRMTTSAAPISPNTAPEAPAVNPWGDKSSAPSEPDSSEVK